MKFGKNFLLRRASAEHYCKRKFRVKIIISPYIWHLRSRINLTGVWPNERSMICSLLIDYLGSGMYIFSINFPVFLSSYIKLIKSLSFSGEYMVTLYLPTYLCLLKSLQYSIPYCLIACHEGFDQDSEYPRF